MLLLDTCTFIWLTSDPSRLSTAAKRAIDSEEQVALSDVSIWEICLKWQAGKLTMPSAPRVWVKEQAAAWRLDRLAIDPEHFYRSTEIADLHRDPFDRLLVAQALAAGTTIVTPDPAIHQYPVSVAW